MSSKFNYRRWEDLATRCCVSIFAGKQVLSVRGLVFSVLGSCAFGPVGQNDDVLSVLNCRVVVAVFPVLNDRVGTVVIGAMGHRCASPGGDNRLDETSLWRSPYRCPESAWLVPVAGPEWFRVVGQRSRQALAASGLRFYACSPAAQMSPQ